MKGAKGVKGSEAYSILGFRVPTTWNGKSSITTYSGQMSPPPANRTTTTCTLTALQKAFIGPTPSVGARGEGAKGSKGSKGGAKQEQMGAKHILY